MGVRRPRLMLAGCRRHRVRMKTAYFALGVKQLDAFSGGGVSYGVVVTLFIITHGVKGRRRRGPGC
jgi:hypothetical protein